MRLRPFALLASLTLLSPGFAQEEGDPLRLSVAEVQQLVESLGSSEFAQRETAELTLSRADSSALPLLAKEWRASQDLEVRSRLEDVAATLGRRMWHRDMAAAQEVARRDQKSLMVFSTIGELDGFSCMGGNLMRSVTFANTDLLAQLQESFVLLWHNQDPNNASGEGDPQAEASDFQPTLAEIEAYPVGAGSNNMQTYFCTTEGLVLHYLRGYWPADQFSREVAFANEQYEQREDPATLTLALRRRQGELKLQQVTLQAEFPGEFRKPVRASQVRRQHAALGLRVESYEAAVSCLGQQVNDQLLASVRRNIDWGVIS